MSASLRSPLLRWSAGIGMVSAILVALLLGPGTSLKGGGAKADSAYRVDVIFDTAKGIIPGQLAKIAGARVGTIKDVVLTPDYKARIQMEVDPRFRPFHTDAKCNIQPEGLISERFVQCDPGTQSAPVLEPENGQAPTVPVTSTSVPVAITDLFNIFRVPVRERLTVVLSTLGIGVAGRGEDLNGILRRANPTLALTRKALNILGDQRRALRDTVIAVDKVSGDLARRPQSVTRFLDQAADVSKTTADHSTALGQAINRLPRLLDEVQPTMRQLNGVAADGTPVLRDLRAATPGLSALVDQLGPFSDVARPALDRVAVAGNTGRGTIRVARPVVSLLKAFADKAGPTGTSLNALLVNLQERGGVENLLKFIYGAAAASSRYDAVSHILPAHLFLSACGFFAQTPVAGCSANYGQTATTRAKAKPAGTKKRSGDKRADEPKPEAAPPTPTPTPAATPTAPKTPGTTLQIPGLPPINLPALPDLGKGGKGGSGNAGDLLDYLLGS